MTTYIAIHVACSIVGYRLILAQHLRRFDFTRSDRAVFVVLSTLGPPALLAGLLIWVMGWVSDRPKADDVLIDRRTR